MKTIFFLIKGASYITVLLAAAYFVLIFDNDWNGWQKLAIIVTIFLWILSQLIKFIRQDDRNPKIVMKITEVNIKNNNLIYSWLGKEILEREIKRLSFCITNDGNCDMTIKNLIIWVKGEIYKPNVCIFRKSSEPKVDIFSLNVLIKPGESLTSEISSYDYMKICGLLGTYGPNNIIFEVEDGAGNFYHQSFSIYHDKSYYEEEVRLFDLCLKFQEENMKKYKENQEQLKLKNKEKSQRNSLKNISKSTNNTHTN
jgi:hypothetical protein